MQRVKWQSWDVPQIYFFNVPFLSCFYHCVGSIWKFSTIFVLLLLYCFWLFLVYTSKQRFSFFDYRNVAILLPRSLAVFSTVVILQIFIVNLPIVSTLVLLLYHHFIIGVYPIISIHRSITIATVLIVLIIIVHHHLIIENTNSIVIIIIITSWILFLLLHHHQPYFFILTTLPSQHLWTYLYCFYQRVKVMLPWLNWVLHCLIKVTAFIISFPPKAKLTSIAFFH